ncbi:hypothetical protein ACIGHG_10775 [Bacillus sp. NPDC077411]|uniref:hypothetical protein n=1 Tax=Bacillus sp. NPDC077411 TaxID=3363947 RepID=UPI0037CB7022
MGKVIGLFLILAGCIPLVYLIISIFKGWREKGSKFVVKSLVMVAISIILNTGGIVVCIGIIILGFAFVLYG